MSHAFEKKIWERILRVTWRFKNRTLGGVSKLRVIAELLAAEMQGDEGYIAGFSGQLDGISLRLVE